MEEKTEKQDLMDEIKRRRIQKMELDCKLKELKIAEVTGSLFSGKTLARAIDRLQDICPGCMFKIRNQLWPFLIDEDEETDSKKEVKHKQ
jgi:hypothetical protein